MDKIQMETDVSCGQDILEIKITPNENTESSSLSCNDVGGLSMLLKARELNEECQHLLEEEEKNLKHLLDECRKESSVIERRLRSVNITKPYPQQADHCIVFGMPYFKDEEFYPCPPNRDTLEKQRLNFPYAVDLPRFHPWRVEDMHTLANCIHKYELERLTEAIDEEKRLISEERKACDYELQTVILDKKLRELEDKADSIKDLPLASLVKSRKCEYDWLKISAQELRGLHTADECRSMWFNYLHPDINKQEWTDSDDEQLKAIATKHKCQDWSSIANELGQNRSAYQCMCRFHTCSDKKKCHFSPDENYTLQKLVKRFRIGLYIPWQKIALYMDGRTRRQIYRHWIFSAKPNLKKGPFSEHEDVMIVAGVRKFGLNFGPIAKYFPCRTTFQVRRRFYSLLHMQSRPRHWSTNEDVLLLKLIETYGENRWRIICKKFRNRTDMQIKNRYQTLKRWLQKNPESTVPQARSRSLKKTRHVQKMWKDVQKLVIKEKIPHEKINGEVEVNEKSLSELSNLLVSKGTDNEIDEEIHEKFLHYFRHSYSAVDSTKKSMKFNVSSSSYQTALFLFLMHADLNLSSASKKIKRDKTMPEEEKRVLKHLSSKKSLLSIIEQNVSSNSSLTSCELSSSSTSCPGPPDNHTVSTQLCTVDSSDSSSLLASEDCQHPCKKRKLYRCPPNYTTAVGLRTLLLHCRRIEEKVKYRWKDKGRISQSDQISAEARKAINLFKERMAALFTFPALMSNKYPSFPQDLFVGEACVVSHTELNCEPGRQQNNDKNIK
ncbi:snRNA-activating protein complex subunit 4 [Anabrus simplex]|uniref:snRNA-activating protein complex subunit 4 n=1 Tax=Anabrus simplex TaxID=316456 RepID=UPI0035A3C97A